MAPELFLSFNFFGSSLGIASPKIQLGVAGQEYEVVC
jgi:hypothetical protein